MWLICGLGNPTKKYDLTRHNLGFDFIHSLIFKNQLNLYKRDRKKEIYRGKINDESCIICKPLVYMNLSGIPIKEITNFYKIPLSKIIIIHDDLDIEVGKIKIKNGGSNAGHNGLLSIDESIGKNYKRIRIGIGHPGSKELVSEYVLNKFSNEERKIIDEKIEKLTLNFSLIFESNNHLLTKLALK